ncbi:hypothetical protein MBLNU13_g08874t1 [Cladosporium sp. NU13]
MSTSPVDPRKMPRVDNDKDDPPRGAYKRSSKDCLPVAIPGYTLEANAAALLVSEQDFNSAIAHTITNTRVLTAWVPCQMTYTDAGDSRTISKWRLIDDIIASRSQLWDAQYRSNSELYLSPVELVRMKVCELNALAVFVLCRRIQDNARGTNELNSSLTYHTYYRTFMSRMYLAAHVLTFLRYYTNPSSVFSAHRPKDVSLIPAWLKNDKVIRSLDGLWASIKSSDSPILWMYHENEDHTTTTPATAQQTVQRDFSSHAILKLEPLHSAEFIQ